MWQLGTIKNSITILHQCKWNSGGFLYNGDKKFQLMLILPHEFNKRTYFWLTVFEIVRNINSCSNLFLVVTYFIACKLDVKADVACPVVFGKGKFTSISTLEHFKLTQWPSWNYFLYLVGLHQVKNGYSFKDWYIKTNIEKIYFSLLSSDLLEPKYC